MEGATPTRCSRCTTPATARSSPGSGPGIVVDVGCGIGRRDRAPRRPGPARRRRRLQQRDDARRRATRAMPRRARSAILRERRRRARPRRRDRVDYVVSSHIIEHFVNPGAPRDRARARAAPGRHRVRDHAERAGRLREPVPRVPVRARAPRVAALAVLRGRDLLRPRRRRRAEGRLRARGAGAASGSCKLDVFNLRKRFPRASYVWGYEHVLPLIYRLLGTDSTGIGSGIDESHFFLDRARHRPHTPVLFAVARRPRSTVGKP